MSSLTPSCHRQPIAVNTPGRLVEVGLKGGGHYIGVPVKEWHGTHTTMLHSMEYGRMIIDNDSIAYVDYPWHPVCPDCRATVLVEKWSGVACPDKSCGYTFCL